MPKEIWIYNERKKYLLSRSNLCILELILYSRQRPYHIEHTSSRPITEVKQCWARLVLGWVTAWEHWVLLAHTFTLEGRGFESRSSHVKDCLFGWVGSILNTFKHVRALNMNLNERLELTISVDPSRVSWNKSMKSWVVPRGAVAQHKRLVPVWWGEGPGFEIY